MIVIEVCSREEASAILSSPSRRADVAFLISIGEPEDRPPAGYANIRSKLRLLFADTNEEVEGPTAEDVRRLISAAKSLANRSGRVVIHCQAGISRSTAAAVIVYATLLGPGNEDDAVARVLAVRPGAWPNRRMIALADELLALEGRLIAAVEHALE